MLTFLQHMEYHKYKTAAPDRYAILKAWAKENRNNPTDAEKLLWENIKQRNNGFAFRRQHIIADYICDFVCLKKKLIIEVDGGYHNTPEQQEEDRIREERLINLGYKVQRFTNEEIFQELDKVLNIIYN